MVINTYRSNFWRSSDHIFRGYVGRWEFRILGRNLKDPNPPINQIQNGVERELEAISTEATPWGV